MVSIGYFIINYHKNVIKTITFKACIQTLTNSVSYNTGTKIFRRVNSNQFIWLKLYVGLSKSLPIKSTGTQHLNVKLN